MKTKISRLILIITIVSVICMALPFTASAYRIGDIINYPLPTDIIASINGYQLPSYNVDGYTYIVVEDLLYYGFNVTYNDYEKTLTVERNDSAVSISPQSLKPDYYSISSNKITKNILYTNIVTFINGAFVQSYNIDGYTIIQFDELARFGEVAYDNYKREISLNISTINYNPVAEFADSSGYYFEEAFSEWILEYTNSTDYSIHFRPLGDTIIIDMIFHDFYSVSDDEKTEFQEWFDSTYYNDRESFKELLTYVPSLRSVKINMLEGDLEPIASTELFYK